MTKKKLLFILAFFTFGISLAQELDINWHNFESAIKPVKAKQFSILGFENENLLTLTSRFANDYLSLNTYNSNFKLSESIKIKAKRYNDFYIQRNGNQIAIYHIEVEKPNIVEGSKLSFNIFKDEIDLNGKLLSSEKIASIKDLNSPYERPEYFVCSKPSSNGQYLALSILDPYFNLKTLKQHFLVLDIANASVHRELTSTTRFLQDEINIFVNNELIINNKGEFLSAISFRNYGQMFSYQLMGANANGNFNPPLLLKNQQLFMNHVKLLADDDNLYLSGTIIGNPTMDYYESNTLGAVHARYNPTKNLISDSLYIELSADFLKSIGYPTNKKGELIFKGDFYPELFISTDKQKFMLLKHKKIRLFDGQVKEIQNQEMIAISISDNNQIKNVSIIPRFQRVIHAHDLGAEEFLYSNDGVLFIVYNDAIENLTINDLEELEMNKSIQNKETATFIATVGTDGKVKRSLINRYKENGGYLCPKLSFQKENKVYLTLLNSQGQRKIGILQLK